MAQQDTIRPGTKPHIKAGQGKPVGGKGFPKQAKVSETTPVPLSGVHPKTRSQQHNIYAEDLETHTGPMFSTSVSVSPCETCLLNSVGHVLLVSPIPPDSYSLSSLSSPGFPDLGGEGPNRDLSFRFCLQIMSGCGSS